MLSGAGHNSTFQHCQPHLEVRQQPGLCYPNTALIKQMLPIQGLAHLSTFFLGRAGAKQLFPRVILPMGGHLGWVSWPYPLPPSAPNSISVWQNAREQHPWPYTEFCPSLTSAGPFPLQYPPGVGKAQFLCLGWPGPVYN